MVSHGFTIGAIRGGCVSRCMAGAFGNPFHPQLGAPRPGRSKLNFQLRIRMLNSRLGLDCFKEACIPAAIRAD